MNLFNQTGQPGRNGHVTWKIQASKIQSGKIRKLESGDNYWWNWSSN